MALGLATTTGFSGYRFVSALTGVTAGVNYRVIQGPARIGSAGLIIDVMPSGLTEVVVRGGGVDTQFSLRGIGSMGERSILLAALASGQTDAQQRAAFGGAATAVDGVNAVGLLKGSVVIPPTPTPAPAAKRAFGINDAFPSDYDGSRENANLLLCGRPIRYAGGGPQVADPLDISPTGKLLRVNPAYPGGYSTIMGMPYPYAPTKRLRIEGPASANFSLSAIGTNVSITRRIPATGYTADDGSGKVNYPGNKFFEVDFNWSGDPALGPRQNKCLTYFDFGGFGPEGFENAWIAEVVSDGGAYVSKDFWWPYYVSELSKYSLRRALDSALSNNHWDPAYPLTPTTRAKPEWTIPPGETFPASITVGTGNSQLRLQCGHDYSDWGNAKLWQLEPNGPYFPWGARGNQLRLQIVQGTGGSPVWSLDFANKLITLTLAAGGNTVAQVIATSGFNVNGSDLRLYLDKDVGATTGAGNGSGQVALLAPTNFTGGIDPQCRGFYSIERQVELHNAAKVDMHVIFPLAATTAYAAFVGDYLAKNLDPSLKVVGECFNESSWNYDFGAAKYFIARSKGKNLYNLGTQASASRYASASYIEFAAPLLSSFRNAWIAGGRSAADCERGFGFQFFNPTDGMFWAMDQAGVKDGYDSLLGAPYMGGPLCPGQRYGPQDFAGGLSLPIKGMVVFYNGEAYATLKKNVTTAAGTPPPADTANFALATAETVDPALAEEQAYIFSLASTIKAKADLLGLKFSTYEFGYQTILPGYTRLTRDVQTSAVTYARFGSYVAQWAYTYPLSRIVHLGQYSPAEVTTFGLADYLGQDPANAPRYRVMVAFQDGTLPPYVPPVPPPAANTYYTRLIITETSGLSDGSLGRNLFPRLYEAGFYGKAAGERLQCTWAGPDDSKDHSQRFDLPALYDLNDASLWAAPGLYEYNPQQEVLTGTVQASGLSDLASFFATAQNKGLALGAFKLYVSTSPLSATATDGTLLIDFNESAANNGWADNTERRFAL